MKDKIDYNNLTEEQYKRICYDAGDVYHGLTPERLGYIRHNSLGDKGFVAQLLGHIDKLDKEIKQLKGEINE